MKYTKLILIFITALAFFLRFYKVTEIPPALNWDEASIGYNAYSILKTGHDEWGQFLPVHFKAYGEYKLPTQVYLSIPGIYIFGLNELGVRITPIIYGTLTVLVMFFLGRSLFLNQNGSQKNLSVDTPSALLRSSSFQSSLVGLISAFLLAISPWHIQLTRASFESSLAIFFITLGIWFLIKGFINQKWFIIAMIPFALSVFTYNSARIFTPLFLITTPLLYWRQLIKYKKSIAVSIVVFIILLIPLTPYVLSGERSARYKLVSITDDPGLIPRINENRGNSKLPALMPRLVHNKVTYISFYFISNYLSHFTPQFLFISGAPHRQHHVQNIGQLYLFQAPFFIIGLIALFKLKHRFKNLLLSWLFLAFIPVSVTGDSIPHALRTLIAAPFYQLITAFGFLSLLGFIKGWSKSVKLSLGIILTAIVVLSVSYYLNQYYNVYPQKYSRDWQYGYRQVVDYVKKHQSEYDLIVFSRHYGEPHMFTLFFLNYDPRRYQNDPRLVRFETNDWVWVLKFDKFYFPDLGDEGTQFADIAKLNTDKKILFIGRRGDFPLDIPRLFSVDFLNGENAFDIIEVDEVRE